MQNAKLKIVQNVKTIVKIVLIDVSNISLFWLLDDFHNHPLFFCFVNVHIFQ